MASRKKDNRSGSTIGLLFKSLAGAIILAAIVTAAVVASFYMLDKREQRQRVVSHQITVPSRPLFEIYPKHEIEPEHPLTIRLPDAGGRPLVAIIIDDVGYDQQLAERFIKCPVTLTLSILPHSPFNKRIARAAHRQGREVMLHLPMEPSEYPAVNPGPGALLTSMSPDTLLRQLENNIVDVPYIKGVNNHMGSEMTTISTQMYQIFSVMKKRDLFFIDSRTTAETLCRPSARLLKVPFAERDIFLDNIPTAANIGRQLEKLVKIAQLRGYAVGIAHAHDTTCQALIKKLPLLQEKVEFVSASRIVMIAGS